MDEKMGGEPFCHFQCNLFCQVRHIPGRSV